ncbi:MAG: SET domain-containing protein [Planctomycetia bacterium]|nr:SET domain-containing protein [Planctomycetia bacterium]
MTLVEASALVVREGRLGKGVFACFDAPAGAVLAMCGGRLLTRRTRHSVQIDGAWHLDVESPIRYVNHSCVPNCGLLIRRGTPFVELHALRELAAGEEVTIDYATFEDEVRYMPGECHCGASSCRGRVTGFKDLSPEDVEAYGVYVAEHLRLLAAAPCRS